MSAANPVTLPLADYKARTIRLVVDGKVATITLDRPDKKNPLTFDSYAEIVDLFRAAAREKAVKAFVITGAGGNSTVRVTDLGVILVDTKNLGENFYNDLVAQIKTVTNR